MKRVNQLRAVQSSHIKGRWFLAAMVSGALLEGGATLAQADSTPDDTGSETTLSSSKTSSTQQSVTLSTKSGTTTQTTEAETTTEQADSDSKTPVVDDNSENSTSPTQETTSDSDTHANSDESAVPTDSQSSVSTDSPSQPVTPTPVVHRTPATPQTRNLSRIAAEPTTPTTPSDDQVVTFSDAYLAAAVKKALSLTDDDTITIGAIRHYASPVLNINARPSETDTTAGVNDLSGLEALAYLPQSTRIALYLTMTSDSKISPIFDFSPLTSLRFVVLDIDNPRWQYLDNATLSQLTAIDSSTIAHVALTGASYANLNQYGLTNDQLTFLGPWLTAIGNNGCRYGLDALSQINLSGNAISNLSPLSGITAATQVVAIGETCFNNDTVNVVAGQSLTLTPNDAYGLDGALLPIVKTPYSFNTETPGKYRPITNLGNGQLYFSSANQLIGTSYASYITYGQLGFQYGSLQPNVAYTDITYPTGAELIYDTRVFRLANWQAYPTVTVNYTDTQGTVLQAPTVLGETAQVNDTYDLTDLAKISGYDLVSGQTAKLTGTYSTDPQTVTLIFQKTAATIPQTPSGFSEDNPTDLPTPPTTEPTTPDQVAQIIVDQHPTPTPISTAQTDPLTPPEKQAVTQLVLHGGLPNTLADNQATPSVKHPRSHVTPQSMSHLVRGSRQARRHHFATRSSRQRRAHSQATLPQTSDSPATLAALLGLVSLSLLGHVWVKRPH